MPYIAIEIPAGVVRNGTSYSTKGRWYDAQLVRWYPALGPVGGWVAFTSSAMSGSARAIIAWRGDNNTRWIAVGTHTKLYAINSAATLFDITPVGFVSGRASATAATGYGSGPYGAYTYGGARPNTGNYLDATVWDLDNFGQSLVGCFPEDGHIHQWTLSTGSPAAALSGAPTSCSGVVVTPQGFIVALGADGNKRKLQWPDQQSGTDWTPSPTNQAGDKELNAGNLKCGRAVGDQTLILTDIDAHVMDYVGLPFVYDVRKVGDKCGAISKRCVVSTGQFAAWWSKSGFWIYDGAVKPLQCDVLDLLQTNLDTSQRSKISAWHNANFGEIWWEYPKLVGTGENSNYVFWDYRRNVWGLSSSATRPRLCGVGPDVYDYPLLVDDAGLIWQHENGNAFPPTWTSFASTGQMEVGNGDAVMEILGVIPDELSSGQVTMSLSSYDYPNGPVGGSAVPAFDATGYADVRLSARAVQINIFGTENAWRFGSKLRLDARKGGER